MCRSLQVSRRHLGPNAVRPRRAQRRWRRGAPSGSAPRGDHRCEPTRRRADPALRAAGSSCRCHLGRAETRSPVPARRSAIRPVARARRSAPRARWPRHRPADRPGAGKVPTTRRHRRRIECTGLDAPPAQWSIRPMPANGRAPYVLDVQHAPKEHIMYVRIVTFSLNGPTTSSTATEQPPSPTCSTPGPDCKPSCGWPMRPRTDTAGSTSSSTKPPPTVAVDSAVRRDRRRHELRRPEDRGVRDPRHPSEITALRVLQAIAVPA